MRLVIPILCLLLVPTATRAGTHVVAPDGSGDFPTIQAAIGAAVGGDVIELLDGTFTGDGNRDLDFGGKDLVLRSASGNPEACILDAEGGPGNSHRCLSIEDGEGVGARVEDITFQNAYVEGGSAGAALSIRGTAPTVSGCIFRGNRSTGGGALWVQSGTPTIVDCRFEGNVATNDGGGIFLTNSTVPITDCVFIGNTAEGFGGALAANFAASPAITGCTFSGNTAVRGAALRFEDDLTPTIDRCTFSGNISSPAGQGTIDAVNNAVVTIDASLIVGTVSGAAVRCLSPATVAITCSNFFLNDDGDWIDCALGLSGTDGNFSQDPQFCSSTPDADEYWGLQSDSPAAPDNHPNGDGCGLIGAWDVACDVTPVEATSWGRIKAAFR